MFKPEAGEVANTWKFRTVVFVCLAAVIPIWPISVPVFLYFAYRSYVAGSAPAPGAGGAEEPVSAQQSKAQDIAAMHELLSSGALTQEEFDREKKKLLGAH